MKGIRRLFLVFIIILGINSMIVHGWETNQTSSVTGVEDGDTLYIPNDKVRLADIQAPEEGNEPGYSIAKYALSSLVRGKTVYLDTDQKTGRDEYGRLIAVVYVKANSTHYLNVNKALLVQGVAVETDYTNNEFTPSTWTLYIKYAEALEPTTLIDLISLSQTSVLAWLAVGLGTFIGVKALNNEKQNKVVYQIAICVCIISLAMIIVHMGDIYSWRKKLPFEYLPSSTQWPLFQIIDNILNYVYGNPILILLICLIAGLFLEFLLKTSLWEKIVRLYNR
jgi:hypothetical protein